MICVCVCVWRLQFNDSGDNAVTIPSGGTSLPDKSVLSPKHSRASMVLRRNTTEFATSSRERYREQRREHPDQQDLILDGGTPRNSSLPARCSSERTSNTSVGIMRRFTKKGTAVARSVSFHSHVNEGQSMLCCSFCQRFLFVYASISFPLFGLPKEWVVSFPKTKSGSYCALWYVCIFRFFFLWYAPLLRFVLFSSCVPSLLSSMAY